MKKFGFHKIRFQDKYEKVYIAIEELHYQNSYKVNGYYIFRNSKGDEFSDLIPHEKKYVNSYEREGEIQIWKSNIVEEVLIKFEGNYRGNFDIEINTPIINSYDDLCMFSPYGFKNSTYDKITDKNISWELRERFRLMKGSYKVSKPASLIE